jgi:hypothetical protein
MRYFVHSGTDIYPSGERYESAALALEAVERLLAKGAADIRVTEEHGERVSLTTLRDLAVEENENDDA